MKKETILKNLKETGSIAKFLLPCLIVGIFIGVTLYKTAGNVSEQMPALAAAYEIATTEAVEETEKTEEEATPTNLSEVKDGTYQGEGTGYGGPIKLSVTVKDHKITDIQVLDASNETPSFFERAKGILSRILETQSIDVDVVSGATYSSKGLIAAIKNALFGEVTKTSTAPKTTQKKTTAIKKVKETGTYKNGTYEGSGTGFGGTIRVKVVIKKGKLSKITVLEANGEGSSYLEKAKSLFPQMIQNQTTNVDVISGATFSCNGVIQAVRQALSKAVTNTKKKSKTESSTESNTQTSPNTPSAPDSSDTVTVPSDPGKTVPYIDGTFEGTGVGFQGNIVLAVTIQSHKITKITVKESEDDAPFFPNAMALLPTIIQNQDANVDIISGATYSSKGLIEAVKDALSKAKQATDAQKQEEESATESNPEETTEAEQPADPSPEQNTEEYSTNLNSTI